METSIGKLFQYEIMNIEKTISEHAVSDILTPMLESQDRIVTEDVAPLFDQATGLDTPPASGTVTTTIEESRSVITAIIRKAWTATLTMLGGASVLSSIAAAYTYLRNRLQGNETYGIPDRRSEISASSPLAANLALLNDRKIGGADTIDGISLPHVMFSTAGVATVTEINDTNTDWDIIAGSSIARFVNVEKAIINGKGVFRSEFVTSANIKLKEVYIPGATELRRMYGTARGVFTDCPLLEVIEAENAKDLYAEGTDYAIVYECPKLRKLRLGKLTVLQRPLVGTMPDIIHLEIGAGTAISLPFSGWSPTNALDASRTDLIEEGSSAANNLEQFLANFRDYIALRLTDNGSGKTLTLSQAVRNAIHAAESTYGIENIIITQKGWTISPAPN